MTAQEIAKVQPSLNGLKVAYGCLKKASKFSHADRHFLDDVQQKIVDNAAYELFQIHEQLVRKYKLNKIVQYPGTRGPAK